MSMKFQSCVALLSLFATMMTAAPLGLVLSGGGAKGAYEVGVWQALEESGVASNITAISGTSIGAINGALFATQPKAAESLWLEKIDDVFNLNTNSISNSIQKTLDDVSIALETSKDHGKKLGWTEFIVRESYRAIKAYLEMNKTNVLRRGYIDSSYLARALDESIPPQWQKKPSVYATAVEKGFDKATSWCLNDETHDKSVLMLRASAAFPFGFDTVEIDGKIYVDGGWEKKGGDNTPLRPILKNHPEIEKVIVVYLNDDPKKGAEKNRKLAEEAGVGLVEIIPSEDISGWFGVGGTFNASPETAQHLIELGRKDAEAKLRESLLAR